MHSSEWTDLARPAQLPVNVWRVGDVVAQKAGQIAAALPLVRLEDGRLAADAVAEYRGQLERVAGLNDLAATLRQALRSERGARGYVVIDGLIGPDPPRGEDLRLPTAVCALAGTPFRVVDRWDLWQELGVDLDAVPYRFGGVGYNPFHVDLVNATRLPDLFCLFSVRCDPAGGGQTILSNLQDAVARLGQDEIDQLRQPVFCEGRFFGMSGVGEELNPFPVLEALPGDLWRVRFTAKMLPEMPDNDLKRLLQRFQQVLIQSQECFMLRPGQMLIVNQLLLAHGRLALGAGQERIPAGRRRYLRQTYMHAGM